MQQTRFFANICEIAKNEKISPAPSNPVPVLWPQPSLFSAFNLPPPSLDSSLHIAFKTFYDCGRWP